MNPYKKHPILILNPRSNSDAFWETPFLPLTLIRRPQICFAHYSSNIVCINGICVPGALFIYLLIDWSIDWLINSIPYLQVCQRQRPSLQLHRVARSAFDRERVSFQRCQIERNLPSLSGKGLSTFRPIVALCQGVSIWQKEKARIGKRDWTISSCWTNNCFF